MCPDKFYESHEVGHDSLKAPLIRVTKRKLGWKIIPNYLHSGFRYQIYMGNNFPLQKLPLWAINPPPPRIFENACAKSDERFAFLPSRKAVSGAATVVVCGGMRDAGFGRRDAGTADPAGFICFRLHDALSDDQPLSGLWQFCCFLVSIPVVSSFDGSSYDSFRVFYNPAGKLTVTIYVLLISVQARDQLK